jgi:alpha-tubulin suppressor-like RCC1 family protein
LTEITSLRAYPIVSLTAGSEVSFALNEDGAIFGWGNNRSGELGLGAIIDETHIPTLMPLKRVTQVENTRKKTFLIAGMYVLVN